MMNWETSSPVVANSNCTGDMRAIAPSGRLHSQVAASLSSQGFYCDFDGHVAAVFVVDSRIVIQSDASRIVFEDGMKLERSIDHKHGTVELTLFRETEAVLRFASKPIYDSEVTMDDPTPFVEEEDFDFYLFLKQLLSSEERRRVFAEVHE